jgi:hypothetical protein
MSARMSIVDQVKGIMDDAAALLHAEGRLVRTEAVEKVEQMQNGFLWLAAGLLALMIAAFVLVQAGIDWLAQAIGRPGATLTFGLAFLVIGAILFVNGRQKLKLSNLRPARSIDAARRSAQSLRGAL